MVEKSSQMSLRSLRTRLLWIWSVLGGALFVTLVIASSLGRFEDKTVEVWNWFGPTVFPTISLMIGVIGAEIANPIADRRIDAPFATFVQGACVLYLVLLAAVVLIGCARPDTKPLDQFHLSNAWLGLLQGLVVATISYVFHSAKEPSKKSGGKDN